MGRGSGPLPGRGTLAQEDLQAGEDFIAQVSPVRKGRIPVGTT